jgi:hypothetical protein
MTQAYNLSQFANNLNSAGQLDATDGLVNAVPIANGGTGASSASGAANNLVAEFGKLLYPIGTIYINSSNSANPSTYLGFGTWSAFGAGRVPVGFNASNPLFDTAEETGGSADAITVNHTHTATVTDPGHNHSGYVGTAAGGAVGGGNAVVTGTINANTGSAFTDITVNISSTGSSGTNANYQPYITVYMWKRTA